MAGSVNVKLECKMQSEQRRKMQKIILTALASCAAVAAAASADLRQEFAANLFNRAALKRAATA